MRQLSFDQHSPDGIQIHEDRTTIPPPRELHPRRSMGWRAFHALKILRKMRSHRLSALSPRHSRIRVWLVGEYQAAHSSRLVGRDRGQRGADNGKGRARPQHPKEFPTPHPFQPAAPAVMIRKKCMGGRQGKAKPHFMVRVKELMKKEAKLFLLKQESDIFKERQKRNWTWLKARLGKLKACLGKTKASVWRSHPRLQFQGPVFFR